MHPPLLVLLVWFSLSHPYPQLIFQDSAQASPYFIGLSLYFSSVELIPFYVYDSNIFSFYQYLLGSYYVWGAAGDAGNSAVKTKFLSLWNLHCGGKAKKSRNDKRPVTESALESSLSVKVSLRRLPVSKNLCQNLWWRPSPRKKSGGPKGGALTPYAGHQSLPGRTLWL